MTTHHSIPWAILALFTLTGVSSCLAGPADDTCGGPYAFLALLDRPTKSDSVCAVPYKQAVLEVGYQYQNLQGGGSAQNYPEAELRIGLPHHNEFIALLPNYNHQTVQPHTGYNATTLGLKHALGTHGRWSGAVEALVGLPSGGGAFGSNKYQPVVTGVVQYAMTPSLSLAFMLGAGSQAVPPVAGGQSYFTVNPDLVLSWQASEKIQAYGEIYGQSRTTPHSGAGFDADAGILYLLTPYLEVDAEYGHRMSGSLGGFNQFVGAGMGILFG